MQIRPPLPSKSLKQYSEVFWNKKEIGTGIANLDKQTPYNERCFPINYIQDAIVYYFFSRFKFWQRGAKWAIFLRSVLEQVDVFKQSVQLKPN